MGLLKNIVKNAVNDGIRKGVSTGVGNALGKAVENAVKPAADRWANKTAQSIDNAASEMSRTLNQASEATAEAGNATAKAAASMGGLSALEESLSGLSAQAEKIATRMSASMKICPSCGEASQGDKTFCPHCGAKLPETTLGQDYTCTQCGTANTPGTKYCSKCGALLPGAEAEIKAQQAKDEQVLAQFAQALPSFPKWTAGGKEFKFEQDGTFNGFPMYRLAMTGGRKELDAYIALLKQAGFMQDGDSFWRTIDGVCRTFDFTDAISGNSLDVCFFVSNKDKDAARREAARLEAEQKAKDPLSTARSIFKMFKG